MFRDERIEKHANIIVNYCLKLKEEELLVISASAIAEPLIKAVIVEATKVGAYVETFISFEGEGELFYKHASDKQLKNVPLIRKFALENADAWLEIFGGYNTKSMAGIDPDKISKRSEADKVFMGTLISRMSDKSLRWLGTEYPTLSKAQEAGMSYMDYQDFVYSSCLIDEDDPVSKWIEVGKNQERLCNYMDNVKSIRIVSKDTDLTMSVEGRKWINCDGQVNFPDGEIFTSPVKNSINGVVRFSYPGIYKNKEVEDIRLTFKDGKVVKAEAEKGNDLLLKTLEIDEGAKYIGELGIGTNYGIDKFTKNILFDEKMGGTIHLALGAALPDAGGHNQSAIHWDLLCDMSECGQIFADGELIYEKGKWIIQN